MISINENQTDMRIIFNNDEKLLIETLKQFKKG